MRAARSDVITLPHAAKRVFSESITNHNSTGGYGWPSTLALIFPQQLGMREPPKSALSLIQMGASTGTPHVILWHSLLALCRLDPTGMDHVARDHEILCLAGKKCRCMSFLT
ncbi:unnamed protein product [Fusarium graminearum]|nr:unnamed protein product [Fusarium graminearum]CAG1969576.1 unnamed protein product [Fusarium graminearum]VTO93610.1 unnamed protein product [Fusarium graminearum]